MQGRTFPGPGALGRYKYGFNGKENDNETVGTGQGTQDYGMRIYNPALGKFLSVDPLQKEFAWNSSYAFAENDVIRSIDLDGKEKNFVFYYEDKSGTRLTHTVPYQTLHPGEKQGPLGSGDYVMVQNPKTKQFTGGYVKSFEDVSPVKAFFGPEYNGRYDNAKGLRQLGKDADPVLQVTGKVLKVTGTVASAIPHPVAQAYSKIALPAGEYVGDAGDALEITDAALDGDINKVVVKSANVVLNKAAGQVIEKTAGSEVDANISSTGLDLITDEGSDAFIELNKKDEKPEPKKK